MENQKPDDESESSGMEILENVINSNEINTASNEKNMQSNAELGGDMEDLLLAIGQLQLDLEVVKETSNEALVFYEKEQVARNQFLASIPTEIETALSQETRDYLENFKNEAKRSGNLTWGGLGTTVLGILIFIIAVNFATNWYKESIKAKSELRQDILNEIADEGKKIYDENEIKILQDNTKVMQLWIKSNPKKAEDFLRFKDGFEARE